MLVRYYKKISHKILLYSVDQKIDDQSLREPAMTL